MRAAPTAARIARAPALWHIGMVVVLAGAIGIVYWALIAGDGVLPWDATTEFFPNAFFESTALRAGHLPWWNPWIYGGVPQIADPQAMTFSPLLVAWMLASANPSPTWFACAVLLHLLLGGWAFAVFARNLGNDFTGCAAGALVFIFGGVATARIEHVPIIIAYCYLAMAGAAYTHFRLRPTRARAGLLGITLGFFGVHLVQVTYLGAWFLLAFVIFDWFDKRHADLPRPTIRRVAAYVCAPALAICLAQIVSTLAYLGISNRNALALADSAGASLTWNTLATLFFPNHFHALSGTYDGPADLTEAYLYIGLLPVTFLLAQVGTMRRAGSRRPLAFFLVLALVAFLYMLGTHAPVYGWLHDWLPGVDLFRRPSDAAFIFNLALAALTAFGFSALHLHSRWLRSGLSLLAGAWLAWNLWDLDRDAWQIGTALALGALVAACLWSRRARVPGAIAILALLVIDYSATLGEGRLFAGDDLTTPLRESRTRDYLRDAAHASPGAWRIEAADTSIWWDNFVIFDGIRSTQGYNPIRYRLFDRVYGARSNGNAPRPAREGNAVGGALFNLLSVRYFLTARPPVAIPPADFRKVVEDDRFDLWENPRAYPRLLTPRHMQLLAADRNPPAEAFEENDFREAGWITPRDARDRTSALAKMPSCTGRLTLVGMKSRLDALSVIVAGDRGGWLVVNDPDFPGWTAKLDGEPVPMHRANRLFTAICVPAGRHKVKLAFHLLHMIGEALSHPSSYD